MVRDAGNRALPSSSLAEYALKVGQAIDMARSVEGVKAMLMEGMLPVPPSPSGAPTPGRDGTGEAAAVPPAADECADCGVSAAINAGNVRVDALKNILTPECHVCHCALCIYRHMYRLVGFSQATATAPKLHSNVTPGQFNFNAV